MIRTPEEKFYFFQSLTDQLDHFPLHVCKYRVLPALTSSLSLGATSGETSMGVAGPIVLVPLLKLGKTGNALFVWSHTRTHRWKTLLTFVSSSVSRDHVERRRVHHPRYTGRVKNV